MVLVLVVLQLQEQNGKKNQTSGFFNLKSALYLAVGVCHPSSRLGLKSFQIPMH